MARRQGLMFQTPDQMVRVQNARSQVIGAANLYGRGSNTKTTGPKESGLSKGAKAAFAAAELYKGADAVLGGVKAAEGANAVAEATKSLTAAQEGLSAAQTVPEIASGLAKEGTAEIAMNLATEVAPAAAGTTTAAATTGGTVAGESSALAEVGALAAKGGMAAYAYLASLFSDRRLKRDIVYFSEAK